MSLDLDKEDMQKVVLMTGSKKAFGTFLGLEIKEVNALWEKHQLLSPLNWIRSQSRSEQLELLAKAGSLKNLAKKLACSETALRPIYMGEPQRALDWSADFLIDLMVKYKSVKLVAHVKDINESLVRKCAAEHEIELSTLIDYSFGMNSNSKGRRAELEYANLREKFITEDKNITEGSQADWDFDDRELGRVNVKSSKMYMYRARTRREAPEYWKFSSSGWANCDHFVVLCYNEKMNSLIGIKVVEAEKAKHSMTLTILREELESPNALRS